MKALGVCVIYLYKIIQYFYVSAFIQPFLQTKHQSEENFVWPTTGNDNSWSVFLLVRTLQAKTES